jgi:lysophospholipase L1-like esterase
MRSWIPIFALAMLISIEGPSLAERTKIEQASDKIVLCIGDSITQGAGMATWRTDCYPSQLQNLLGAGWKVVNAGRSGAGILRKGQYPYESFPEYELAMKTKADVIVIIFGTNDSKTISYAHVADFEDDFHYLLDGLRAGGRQPRILIGLPTPVLRKLKSIDEVRLEPIRERLRSLARAGNLQMIDLPAAFKGHEERLEKDGVHPDVEGMKLIAESVQKAIINE